MDLQRVRDTLKERAREVCLKLLPAGKEDRGMWRCGDAHNTPGQSLCVHLSGPMQGMWTDFAVEQGHEEHGGDLLKLWQIARGCNFRRALEEVGREFGIPEDDKGFERKGMEPREPRAPTQNELLARLRAPVEGGLVWKWLVEKRKITPDVIGQYRIGEYRGKWRDGADHDFVVFPYFDEKGKLVLLKYRDIANKANMWTWPRLDDGGKVILFGLQALGQKSANPFYSAEEWQWPKDLMITEGELDAMALAVYGYPGVSLPFGAQGTKAVQTADGDGPVHVSKSHEKWLENMHEWLQGFETIYLSGDNDKAGKTAWVGIPQRLGEFRIRYVTWPDGHKDANECLQFEVPERLIHGALKAAAHCDPKELIRAEALRDEIRNEYWPKDGKEEGDPLPWTFPFLFRPGQCTIWQGWPGSGKTVCIDNCLVWWANKLDRKVCITSLEWPTHETYAILGRIAMAKRRPHDEAEFNRLMVWLNEHFLAFHSIQTTSLEDILRVWGYAAKKYGCYHFVLDALLRVKGANVDDLNAQRDIMNALINFADTYRVHVHLVAHSKKPDQKHDPRRCWPSKYDISGSSDLANLSHCVICVWRNTGKEEALFEANLMDANDPERQRAIDAWSQREDTLLVVQKQRKTGQEGHKRLWFDKDNSGGSFRFREERTVYGVESMVDGEEVACCAPDGAARRPVVQDELGEL